MKIGCFALVDPFQNLEHQLKRIADMGFTLADVTDSHSGGSIAEVGEFGAAVSLDDNPIKVKRLFEKYGLSIPTFCAHASLLDPSSPARYGTNEIMKAVKMAALMEIPYVITTESEAKTKWGERLSFKESVFIISEKLYEPLILATDLGVSIMLEPHGPLTDTIKGTEAILEALGNPDNLGVNIDTGNSWLGGTDPVEYAKTFKSKIWHVHWKDLPKEWEEYRGKRFGCGFSPIALGEGVIDIAGVYNVLKDVHSGTLEIGGDENMKNSYEYLKSLGAE